MKFSVLKVKIEKRKGSSQCLTTKRSPKESGGTQQEWKRKGEVGGGGWGRKKEKERGAGWEGIRTRSTQVMGSKVFPKPLGREV